MKNKMMTLSKTQSAVIIINPKVKVPHTHVFTLYTLMGRDVRI